MAITSIIIVVIASSVLIFMSSSSSMAQKATAPSLPPSPAPSPAPPSVNLANLLSVAGPFNTFLKYLIQTQVLQTFQNQANNTERGITIFAPEDSAFSSLKKPSLSNLTSEQLESLLLFHAFPKYYSLSDFKALSGANPRSTFAGGSYTLNLTDSSGLVRVHSGWTNTKISSSVYSTYPVAVYQVDRVLLPEAIFGAAPPPVSAPAPAPAPDVALASDLAPSVAGSSPKSSQRLGDESSCRRVNIGVANYCLALLVSAVLVPSLL